MHHVARRCGGRPPRFRRSLWGLPGRFRISALWLPVSRSTPTWRDSTAVGTIRAKYGASARRSRASRGRHGQRGLGVTSRRDGPVPPVVRNQVAADPVGPVRQRGLDARSFVGESAFRAPARRLHAEASQLRARPSPRRPYCPLEARSEIDTSPIHSSSAFSARAAHATPPAATAVQPAVQIAQMRGAVPSSRSRAPPRIFACNHWASTWG